ncbi:hypothetical protein RI543_004779 [Arxiozyma heterogenica]|uniref:Uncharacterized protein n=1 Tax=Arxiozyma heterogenica TaxID=278026 RepID=A0AAN7ZWW6_9SACH|nr:hypothetical protein RI543_004779 [Kazachstania heterogenica]
MSKVFDGTGVPVYLNISQYALTGNAEIRSLHVTPNVGVKDLDQPKLWAQGFNKNVQSQLSTVPNITPGQKYIVEKDTNSYTLLRIDL